MSRHVVGPLVVMRVASRFLGGDLFEECFQILTDFRRRILLNQERSGSVSAEDRQQARFNRLSTDPGPNGSSYFNQPASIAADLENKS